jgi:sugar phosphate isomerase/epimerase
MMSPMKISLIPNDLSMDLEAVFKICAEEHVKYVELAYMWNKSILDLDESELIKVQHLMDKYGLKAASIQTQILKVFAPDSKLAAPGSKNMHRDYDYNLSRIDRAIEIAQRFHAKYIVSYSFFTHLSQTKDANWQRLIKDYAMINEKCRKANVTMVVECEGDTLIATIQDYLRLFTTINSPHVRANFDLANLHSKQKEFTRADFEQIAPYVPYFHVKDRKMPKWRILPAKGAVFGEGNIPWPRILPWFAQFGFDGFLSVEPHVHGPDRMELGRRCVQNLQKLLRDLNFEFE